jgi:serine/threonine protein kinase/predicted Zn-dependent protease
MHDSSNPYVIDLSLRAQAAYFGRQDVLDWAAQELGDPGNCSLVLYGQRRIGKTSLLLQLQRTLLSDGFLPVYFDLQDAGSLPLGQVLADLAAQVAEQVGVEPPSQSSFDDQGQFFRHTFLPGLYETLENGRRPVFLLDEFGALAQTSETAIHERAALSTLLPYLRDLMDADTRPAFVFATGRHADDLLEDYEAAFKTSLVRKVSMLDSDSATALVRQAETEGTLRFDERAVARILGLTNCHPYFIQLFCNCLWEGAHRGDPDQPPLVSVMEVDAVVPDVLSAAEDAFTWFWDGLSPAEKVYAAALAQVAAREGDAASEDRVRHVLGAHAARLDTPAIQPAPRHLEQRGVLEAVQEREHRFVVELLRLWLREHMPLQEVEDELDRIEPETERLFLAGQSAFQQGEWEASADQFGRALECNPRHFRARLCLGEALLELGEVEQAVAELDRAYQMDMRRSRDPLIRALRDQMAERQRAGDEDGLLAVCERVLGIFPDEAMAQEARTAIWTRRGDASLAQGALEEALAAYRQIGAQGWEDAIAFIQSALDQDPDRFHTRLHLGEVLLELGRPEAAVAELDRAYELYPDEAQSLLTSGLIAWAKVQEQEGDQEGALATCERALKISPRERLAREMYTRIWIQRGDAEMERDAPYMALAAYQRAGAEDWRDAITFVRRALERNPGLFHTRLHLGQVLLELGRLDEAVAELEHAYELNPDEGRFPLARALVAWAKVKKDAGEEEGALLACERATELSPNERDARALQTAIWIRRGDAALRQDKLDIALAAYQLAGDDLKIAEVEGHRRRRDYETLEREAVAYEQARQWARAAEIYQRLLAETDDDQLQDKWRIALQRVRGESSRTELEGWSSGHTLDVRYRILKQLAITTRSEIYLAEELQPPYHTVVVKRLKPEKLLDQEMCKRFEREIIALRQIRHQSALFIYDSKTIGQDRYFVAEYADKGTLKEYLSARRGHKLSPIEALEIALSVCQGLEEAHRQGIIHRDVKPGNIFLASQRDGSILAKLADFSIARVPLELREEALTESGAFMGTLPYASLEQINGEVADPQSDLYSWAVVFFQMLTGESPTDSLKDPLNYHPTSSEYPASFFAERGVPSRLIEVVQKNLQRDRASRYQSATQVREALEAIRSQIVTDIEHRLSDGEAHIRALDWQAADAEFEQGLALCSWYGRPRKLRSPVGTLMDRLRMGHLCAQGMMHMGQHRWEAANEALEPLRTLSPNYMDMDIAAQLRLAQSEHRFGQKYQLLLQHRRQENWAEIVRMAGDLSTTQVNRPASQVIDDIRELALYAEGRQLLADNELERAYQHFYRLYERDPEYEDVADLCTMAAYQNAMRQDIPTTNEHRVNWLEKVIEIDPDNREGRTRQQLDRARRRWAEELLEEDQAAGIAQLERISLDYSQRTEVYQSLVNSYYQLLREGRPASARGKNPDAEAEARYRLAVERRGRGELESAAELLAAIDPQAKEFQRAQWDLVQIYITLGRRGHQSSQPQEAAEWWHRALSISKQLGEEQWTEVHQALVDEYYQLLQEGSYATSEWADLDAESEARYRLGEELWSAGDLRGAVEQLTAIQPQTQEFAAAQRDLVRLYDEWGNQAFKRLRFVKAIGRWFRGEGIANRLKGAHL